LHAKRRVLAEIGKSGAGLHDDFLSDGGEIKVEWLVWFVNVGIGATVISHLLAQSF